MLHSSALGNKFWFSTFFFSLLSISECSLPFSYEIQLTLRNPRGPRVQEDVNPHYASPIQTHNNLTSAADCNLLSQFDAPLLSPPFSIRTPDQASMRRHIWQAGIRQAKKRWRRQEGEKQAMTDKSLLKVGEMPWTEELKQDARLTKKLYTMSAQQTVLYCNVSWHQKLLPLASGFIKTRDKCMLTGTSLFRRVNLRRRRSV